MAASVFEPMAGEVRGQAVGDWHPTRYTPSLTGTEDFPTQGDKLLPFVARHWSIPDAETLTLDEWAEWLIRHVLETYPDDWPVAHLRGQLRYRQVVISMGRQNGKSLLAAIFVLFFLCQHVRGPRIIGLASKDGQAKIVYDRVRYGIDNSPALAAGIKTTGTRGITRRDGRGSYFTLPAKEESAQGEPATGAIYDELHLGLAALWDALVLAQKAQRNALLVGITTAGDDSSELLVRLYRDGEAAIDGQDERFGFFVWEADSDEMTEAGVIAANPAVACGRIPLDLTMAEARKMYANLDKGPDGLTGRQRAIRYTLNRFIQGAADAWASTTAWRAGASPEPVQHQGPMVWGIDRTQDWEYGSITATTHAAGVTRTNLVASFVEPSYDDLLEACVRLARRGLCVFAMDATTLRSLGKELRERGYEVWLLGAEEMHAAAQHTQAAIARRAIQNQGDPLVNLQMGRGRRRTTGDSWRLSRSLSLGHIDAVISTVVGAYVAALQTEDDHQIW